MIMNTASGMMEYEGQNNDIWGTKRYNNIPLVPPNSFGLPTMVAVVVDFKDRVLKMACKLQRPMPILQGVQPPAQYRIDQNSKLANLILELLFLSFKDCETYPLLNTQHHTSGIL